MKLPAWKALGWAVLSLPLLGSVGCSGINASHSVSPIDFLIPGGGGLFHGLLYVPPAAPQSPTNSVVLATEIPKQVALVR
jgi:hypothetical protein